MLAEDLSLPRHDAYHRQRDRSGEAYRIFDRHRYRVVAGIVQVSFLVPGLVAVVHAWPLVLDLLLHG